MTDLRFVTKVSEDLATDRMTADEAREAIADHLSTTVVDLTPAMNWARMHFDPATQVASLTWHPMTQTEATIMACELQTQRRARYRRG